jgi:hypothetical protein
MLKRLTDEEVIKYFGDYSRFLRDDGTVTYSWEIEILRTIPLPAPLPLSWNPNVKVNYIKCHRLIVPYLLAVFNELYSKPELWGTINDYGGCYMFRASRGTKSPSRHCHAIAIDLDVCDNPFKKKPNVHPGVIDVFAKHGFMWGGHFNYKRIDGMHWEFANASLLT